MLSDKFISVFSVLGAAANFYLLSHIATMVTSHLASVPIQDATFGQMLAQAAYEATSMTSAFACALTGIWLPILPKVVKALVSPIGSEAASVTTSLIWQSVACAVLGYLMIGAILLVTLLSLPPSVNTHVSSILLYGIGAPLQFTSLSDADAIPPSQIGFLFVTMYVGWVILTLATQRRWSALVPSAMLLFLCSPLLNSPRLLAISEAMARLSDQAWFPLTGVFDAVSIPLLILPSSGYWLASAIRGRKLH